MAVLYINLNEGNNVFKDINRTKDELNDVLSYLNSAYNQMSGAIYINGLQNYRDRITSEKRLVQEDITKVINFSKAYKNFLDNAKEIDKNYAKIISDEGYAYRKETGLLKEEWKRAGKLIIGTLVIAGTVIAAVFIGGPILIGAAVGACVSATLGAGMGYLTGGKDGAIDGFFSGAITGALSGAIGGGIGGVPPAMGSAPKEILKFMGKQSLIDGGVEGLGGGILGFINDGAKGAINGTIGGFVSGAVTGFISGGVSFKFPGKFKVTDNNIKKTNAPTTNGKFSRELEVKAWDEFALRSGNQFKNIEDAQKAFLDFVNGDFDEMARKLDLSSPKDKAVFWSGNLDEAIKYSEDIGGVTLETTPGGAIFNNWDKINEFYPSSEWGSKSEFDPRKLWVAISKQYAELTEGSVTAVQAYEGAIWKEFEQIILELKGQNITTIKVNPK